MITKLESRSAILYKEVKIEKKEVNLEKVAIVACYFIDSHYRLVPNLRLIPAIYHQRAIR